MIFFYKSLFSCFFLLLSSVIFAQSSFWVEGQIRPRSEFRNGYKTLQNDSSKTAFFIEQRTRLSVGYQNKVVQLFVAFQDVRAWGSTPQNNKLAGNFSLFQGWAKIKVNPYINFKVGRQTIILDNQRIFGGRNWGAQGTAHDAVVFQYKNDSLQMDLQVGGAYNVRTTSLNQQPYSVTGNYKTMQFVHFHKGFKNINFSVLLRNVGQEVNNVLNFELTAGAIANLKFGNFSATAEGYYQYGLNKANLKTNAYMAAINLGYKFKQFDFISGTDFLSGTNYNQQGVQNNAFNPWMGSNHKFYGYMDYFYVGNSHQNVGLIDSYLTFKYQIIEKFGIGLSYHYFHAPATIQNPLGNMANGSLGHEIDFTFKYKPQKYITLVGGYSQMIGTNTLELLKPSGNINTINNWACLMLDVNLELFRFKMKKKKQ